MAIRSFIRRFPELCCYFDDSMIASSKEENGMPLGRSLVFGSITRESLASDSNASQVSVHDRKGSDD